MSLRYLLSRQNLVKTFALVWLIMTVGAVYYYVDKRGQPDQKKKDQAAVAAKPAEKVPPKWFVSAKGSDVNDGLSSKRPFASIQKAVSVAKPGEAIQLADGRYVQSFRSKRDGKKDKPITIQGSRKAIVLGSRTRIIEINHDHIRLIGFTVDGKFGPGPGRDNYRDKLIYAIGTAPKDGVEGLKIDNMMLKNAGGECLRLRYFAVNNEISNSTIRDCGLYDFRFHEGGKNGEGIYIGTAPEQLRDGKNPTADPDESHNNWVHHNFIQTNANECVDLKEASHDNLVEHNRCTGQKDEESGGMDSRGDNNTFRYNLIYDNVGAGVRLGGDEDDDGINNHVYDNTIKDNKNSGIKILRSPQGKICGNDFSGNVGGNGGGEYGSDMTFPDKCTD